MSTLNSKAPLTSKLLKKAEIKDKPYRIYDCDLKGFVARVLPSGKISYYYEYRNEAGKNKSFYIGRHGDITADQAREIAKNKSADKIKGIDVQAEKIKSRNDLKKNTVNTLREFIEQEYEDWTKAHLVTAEDNIKRITRNFQHLLDTKIEDITLFDLNKWRTERINIGVRPATINRDINTLKAAVSKAVEWGFAKFNPLQGFKSLKVDSMGVTRYLTGDEAKRLLEALNTREQKKREERVSHNKWLAARKLELLPELNQSFVDYLKPMIIVSLYTGVRRGELMKLKWADINLEAGIMTAHGPNTKNKKTRHIPLHKDAVEVLKKWQEQTSNTGNVFNNTKNNKPFHDVNSSWDNIKKAAGLEDVRWHDLRHDFASKLVMGSVDLNTVRELMGHSDIRMTLRYAHLAPEHKAEAVNRLKKLE